MPAVGHHIFIRRCDDRVIAPTTREQRILARTVLGKGREFGLIAFSMADTHLHMENLGKREESVELARRVEISLGYSLDGAPRFVKAGLEEIMDQYHLINTFTYILKQDRRHGLSLDPLRDASNLPDLLGMRIVGQYTAARVRQHLPRIGRVKLLECLGVPSLMPAEGPLEDLVPAAAAAIGRSGLTGCSADVVAARRAVIEIAGRELGCTKLSRLLSVHRCSVFRIMARPVDCKLVTAVRLQVALHGLRQTAPGAFTELGPERPDGPI